jgi:hypothetical protein
LIHREGFVVHWEVLWEETPSNDFHVESIKSSIGSFEASLGGGVEKDKFYIMYVGIYLIPWEGILSRKESTGGNFFAMRGIFYLRTFYHRSAGLGLQ